MTHPPRFYHLTLIVAYLCVNHTSLLLTYRLFSFFLLLFQLVPDQSDDGVLVFHIQAVLSQKLLDRQGKVSFLGDFYLVALAADVQRNLELQLFLCHLTITIITRTHPIAILSPIHT